MVWWCNGVCDGEYYDNSPFEVDIDISIGDVLKDHFIIEIDEDCNSSSSNTTKKNDNPYPVSIQSTSMNTHKNYLHNSAQSIDPTTNNDRSSTIYSITSTDISSNSNSHYTLEKIRAWTCIPSLMMVYHLV